MEELMIDSAWRWVSGYGVSRLHKNQDTRKEGR